MKSLTNFYFMTLLLIFNPVNTNGRECKNALMDGAEITASSSVSGRGPEKARLYETGVWSSDSSDFSQYLKVNLGEIKNVTSIGTQGRAFTMEYIEEYAILYGNNDLDYAEYKDINGNTRLFKGNSDGGSVKFNTFDTPIIAQFIKINPTRWVERISLRVELYGCDYVAETVGFVGSGLVRMNLIGQEIASPQELIRLRMKTNEDDGIILYGKGSQQDVIALQLSDNKLVLSYQLGGDSVMTSLSVGSLLDDNLWHDVVIHRVGSHLKFSVDRVEVEGEINSDYKYLNLNREIFVGGVPNFNNDGIIVKRNFSGCMENLYLNNTNIIERLKHDDSSFQKTNVILSCSRQAIVPVTFKNRKSHIKLRGYQNPSFNITFEFRTFEKTGALLYHKFYTPGYIKLFLKDGKIMIYVEDKDSQNELETLFDANMNDGMWHKTSLNLAQNHIELIVDGQPSITRRIFYMESGPTFMIGGNMPNYDGFLGCMRSLFVESNRIDPSQLPPSDISSEIIVGACQMVDRCNPNPCKNGGVCKQSWDDFECDCSRTGYQGAMCHTSGHPLSCDDFRISNPDTQEVAINIDVDGSGPLKPFPVECKFLSHGVTETHVSHNNREPTEINGFDAPGSFIQDITYDGGMDELIELVNRSYSCQQLIKYRCHNARLFDMSDKFGGIFRPYSWWVSRDNKMMDYWGGSRPGTKRCHCGMQGDCIDSRRWCNCDSQSNEWKVDEGYLREKEHLPVRQLRFGDTGTLTDDKKGEFTLGPLICEEDKLFDNVVTFRKEDGTIMLPPFNMGHSTDIYFQFKTTKDSGTFIYSKGSPDAIKISMLSGKQIQFIFEAGNGPFGINVDSTAALNDNNWHSVLVVRNRKEARIIIDGSKRKGEMRVTQVATRSLTLTSPIYVGATDLGKQGFVGCMRALMFNGKMVDLKHHAEKGLYGVSAGCIGKCDSSPCLNNGTCIEEYSGYTCNCRWTAFKGPICADEIGAYLTRGSYIQYNFVTNLNTVDEKIRIGFLTTNAKGLLFAISSHSGEYFNLILSNSGHLRLVFDYGFERQELIIPDRNLANAQHHDVRIERSNRGSKLSVYIDNYNPYVFNFDFGANQDNQLNQLKSIYLGGNESMSANDMFEGCISRVEFDNFYILNLLYQEDKPQNVFSVPDPVTQNDCEIEPVTYPPELPETNTPPYSDLSIEDSDDSDVATASIIYGAVLAVLFLLLILILILIGRYVSRQKGEYKTYEDSGSKNAPDADTAVLHGQRGHGVKKNHEYFI